MRKVLSVLVSVLALPLGVMALPFVAPQAFGAPPASTAAAQPGVGALSGDQVASLAYAAGFRGQALVIAVAIAGAESKWVASAEGDTFPIHGCECHSHGLWQIRSCPHRDPAVTYDTSGCHPPLDRGTKADLDDPTKNAAVALRLASSSPTGFDNWTTYTDGAYQAWMAQAEAAVAPYAQSSGGTG
ncbi:MAG: hypothetical protein ACRDJU_12290 [Actinomycetota bacterium]